MRNTNPVGGTMDARWMGPYMVTASGKQGVYRLKNLRTKMLLKRKVNATQLKRYREPLNIGRPGNTERDISYNLRVREGRTTTENITSRPKRGNEESQSDPPSKRAKNRQPEESTEPQAEVIITEV